MGAQNHAIGLTGDSVALGSANGLTVNMNSQRLRQAVASLNASKSARSSTSIPRIPWTKLFTAFLNRSPAGCGVYAAVPQTINATSRRFSHGRIELSKPAA